MLITKWHDGMFGLVVGDALGVPVQFMSAEEIKNSPEGPVTGMRGGGVYNKPAGTWSDDSSMAIATANSLDCEWEVDPDSIADNFVRWLFYGSYTPCGEAFDEGNTCRIAITAYKESLDATTCGVTGEYANGNGALMRILPACLFYYDRMKEGKCDTDEIIKGIHAVGSITHNHLRSNMCCGFYYFMVKAILDGREAYETAEDKNNAKLTLNELLQKGIDEAREYYSANKDNLQEIKRLDRIMNLTEFAGVRTDKIKSSGYVIDTIEAAVWCLITTDSYKECMLKAVNLGDDTDTVAAVAGGLAGLYYGYEAIPKEWLDVIPEWEMIDDLCVDVGDKKFRFGTDPKEYREIIYNFINQQYSWATPEVLEGIVYIDIENVDGEYEFVHYDIEKNGKKYRRIDDGFHTTYRFLRYMFDHVMEAALERVETLDTYCAPFGGTELPYGYRLERYEVSKLSTGDISILIQEGDRVTGGAYTRYVSKDNIEGKTYEEVVEQFPTPGITTQDLIDDDELRLFLGFGKRKPDPLKKDATPEDDL